MTVTHDALINHIMSCDFCNGRHDKYCVGGRNLWIDNQADHIASLEPISSRRTAIDEVRRNSPTWARVIENRVIELYETRKAQNAQNDV